MLECITRVTKNVQGHGARGSTHNNITSRSRGQGTQPKVPIEKITFSIPDSASRICSTTNEVIGSLVSKTCKPKDQGDLGNPIDDPK
jgi:hypothetical protein